MRKSFFFLLAFLIIFTSISELRLSAFAEEEVNPDRTVDLNKDSDFMIDQPDYDPKSPTYQKTPSKMAFGFRTAINGVPFPAALGTTFQLFMEYILPWQTAGSLSLGMHVGSFPLYAPSAGIPTNQYQNAIAGALVRYQFRYTPQQLIVPTAALEWEYYHIQSTSLASGPVNGSDFGLSGGLMFNLAYFDRETQFDAYKGIGLIRSYFTTEIRTVNIDNAVFSLSGIYWLWGIRLEFE